MFPCLQTAAAIRSADRSSNLPGKQYIGEAEMIKNIQDKKGSLVKQAPFA